LASDLLNLNGWQQQHQQQRGEYIHYDEKKRSHSVHSNFLRSDNEKSHSKKKNGSFNRRGSYIDYLAEMDGWMDGWSLVEFVQRYIAGIVDA